VVALSGRPRPELADILEEYAPPPATLGRDRRRAIRDIVVCRTPILGGHLQVCDHCGREQPFYNSCRNRHCPKCQSLDQARWVAAQSQHLLPVPYFHVVFTVPPALHPLFLNDRRPSFQMLFAAAGETLNDVCRRRLGATPGVIAVLHTWTQTLRFHPHVHCIVTGGGLSLDRQRWIASRSNFFLPVRVLSTVFKGKLLEHFETALVSSVLHTPVPFGRQRLRQAASTPWVVYSKAPMAGPEQVLRYLGRYTHRIALGNERIVDLHDGQVTFRYRNRRRRNRSQLLTLPAPQFVRLFLLHVLPSRFVRIRHYGLLANGQRSALIKRAREQLGCPAPPEPDQTNDATWQDLYRRLTGRDPNLCPYCKRGLLRVVAVIPVTTSPARARPP
jgi:hypothetical protein